LLVAAALSLTSCSGTSGGKIFDYANSDATLELVFPSEYGNVRAEASKAGGVFTLKVVEPARSAGIIVKWTMIDGRCVLENGDISVPLSAEAAAGLTLVLDLLCRGETSPDEPVVSKSPDGLQTRLQYGDGAVIIGEEGLPSAVECNSIGKAASRTVQVIGYTISDAKK